jgi:phenylacetaldehyde dehydrogenase
MTTLSDSLSQTTRDFVSRAHGMLIGGELVPAASGATFETLNPATASPIASVPAAGPEDIDRAVAAARKAFDEGAAWRKMPAPQRALAIHRLADLIEEHASDLA